jgi:hypothetical protein
VKQDQKYAFLEHAKRQRRRSRPFQCKTRPSPPRHSALGPEERWTREGGPEGGWPRHARLRHGRAPCGADLAHLTRANSIDGEEDGAGVRSGIFPAQPPISTLYKEGESPSLTHTTHNTTPLLTSSRELLTPSTSPLT